mmetsp:Transcript_11650/g.42593  ORF Transcript_11650/g.42593 Transcript_11650/m.42593 type:complete len:226 (-) Transcript_11650:120-797(-)
MAATALSLTAVATHTGASSLPKLTAKCRATSRTASRGSRGTLRLAASRCKGKISRVPPTRRVCAMSLATAPTGDSSDDAVGKTNSVRVVLSILGKLVTLPLVRLVAAVRGLMFDKKTVKYCSFLPIACMGASSTVPLVTSAIASFIKLYLLLLFVRVLLSWFPNVDWMGQPWLTLRQVTDPYLNLFRNIIPPLMGQIDFTPILGFLVLQFIVQVLGGNQQPDIWN